MATFCKLTRIEWNGDETEIWVNLDHVHSIERTEKGAELIYSDGRFPVTETPEVIAFMAYAENPVVAR